MLKNELQNRYGFYFDTLGNRAFISAQDLQTPEGCEKAKRLSHSDPPQLFMSDMETELSAVRGTKERRAHFRVKASQYTFLGRDETSPFHNARRDELLRILEENKNLSFYIYTNLYEKDGTQKEKIIAKLAREVFHFVPECVRKVELPVSTEKTKIRSDIGSFRKNQIKRRFSELTKGGDSTFDAEMIHFHLPEPKALQFMMENSRKHNSIILVDFIDPSGKKRNYYLSMSPEQRFTPTGEPETVLGIRAVYYIENGAFKKNGKVICSPEDENVYEIFKESVKHLVGLKPEQKPSRKGNLFRTHQSQRYPFPTRSTCVRQEQNTVNYKKSNYHVTSGLLSSHEVPDRR